MHLVCEVLVVFFTPGLSPGQQGPTSQAIRTGESRSHGVTCMLRITGPASAVKFPSSVMT